MIGSRQRDASRIALKVACNAVGGQSSLARLIGVSQGTLWHWLARGKRGAPGEHVLAIELATGVPRYVLRPDIFPLPQETPAPRAHPARSAPRTCTHEAGGSEAADG